MRHLRLTENAPARPCDLTDEEAAALDAMELAVISRSPGSSSWLVAAGKKVGAASIGDLQVTVVPKLPVSRLVFMMGYAKDPSFWRDHTVELDREDDLAEALAHTFRRLASGALGQGLMQGYVSADETLPVLRGRIRMREQLSRRFGVGLPLEVAYDEFTVDIAENQILLAAVLRLLRVPSLSRPVRQGLQRLRLQLADVTPPRPGLLLDWVPSRLNVRYQPALRVADLILKGESFEQRVGSLPVSGFVFDMWRIFEDFVTVALKEVLSPGGGTARLQNTVKLDHDGRVDMRPDFLWVGQQGVEIIVDAKYKSEKPEGFPQADIYQMLAYCTRFGLREGHLVYARGNESVASHRIVGADLTIRCHTVELDEPPEVVLVSIAGIAQALRSSAVPCPSVA